MLLTKVAILIHFSW